MTANTVVSANVTFPAGLFTAPPVVTIGMVSSVVAAVRASFSAITKDGMTIYGVRTDTGATLGVTWHAFPATQ
jgi:hypothetical protein